MPKKKIYEKPKLASKDETIVLASQITWHAKSTQYAGADTDDFIDSDSPDLPLQITELMSACREFIRDFGLIHEIQHRCAMLPIARTIHLHSSTDTETCNRNTGDLQIIVSKRVVRLTNNTPELWVSLNAHHAMFTISTIEQLTSTVHVPPILIHGASTLKISDLSQNVEAMLELKKALGAIVDFAGRLLSHSDPEINEKYANIANVFSPAMVGTCALQNIAFRYNTRTDHIELTLDLGFVYNAEMWRKYVATSNTQTEDLAQNECGVDMAGAVFDDSAIVDMGKVPDAAIVVPQELKNVDVPPPSWTTARRSLDINQPVGAKEYNPNSKISFFKRKLRDTVQWLDKTADLLM